MCTFYISLYINVCFYAYNYQVIKYLAPKNEKGDPILSPTFRFWAGAAAGVTGMHTHIYIYVRVCLFVCVYVCLYICVHVFVSISICMYVCVYICIAYMQID